jgi:hypothetical protein
MADSNAIRYECEGGGGLFVKKKGQKSRDSVPLIEEKKDLFLFRAPNTKYI